MKFNDVFKRIEEKTGLKTQAALADALGIKQGSVSSAKGKGSFPFEWAFKIAQGYGLNTDWLLTGKGPETRDGWVSYQFKGVSGDEFDLVPMAETKLNAGGGSVVISENFKESYAFRKDWISRIATSRNNIFLMQVEGDSMEPLIADGDTVMIDAGRKTIHTGRIYALGVSDAIMVKRLELLPDGQIRIISVNPAYSPYVIGGAHADATTTAIFDHHIPLKDIPHQKTRDPQKNQVSTQTQTQTPGPRILGQVIWFARQFVRENQQL
jgi:phage repressor protein C with HTH and peptisase S24 domain